MHPELPVDSTDPAAARGFCKPDPMRHPFFLIALILSLSALWPQPSRSNSLDPQGPQQWLTAAVAALCPLRDLNGLDAQDRLPGSWLLEEVRLPTADAPNLITLHLALPNADELTLERRQHAGRVRQFRAAYHAHTGDGTRPTLLAIADGDCTVQSGRRLREGPYPWRYLDQLDGDLQSLRWTETLQAPWPPGTDPGGVRVGLVDSGLAYDLAPFRDRLARDAAGQPLGYDYWDLDPFPYDGDMARGPFLPIRHGTTVASILAREAPNAALVPYRYPRPDMSRLEDLVARALADGVRILAVPLGSRRPEDWTEFAQAMRAQNILAIVSAGNDGRDIDADPLWPAVLDLDNMIVVTSSDGFGRLAQGSNWGGRSVDIMLPAENIEVTDFRGAAGTASGSSYAVPRLVAMAARLLAAEPNLHANDLKTRILARAAHSPYERTGVVSAGWIPDPLTN